MCDIAMMTALVAALISILGAIVGATVSLVTSQRAWRQREAQGQQLAQIAERVDGPLADALHEVRTLRAEVARLTARLAPGPRPGDPPPGMMQ